MTTYQRLSYIFDTYVFPLQVLSAGVLNGYYLGSNGLLPAVPGVAALTLAGSTGAALFLLVWMSRVHPAKTPTLPESVHDV